MSWERRARKRFESPEENAWPVVAEVKAAAKSAARNAGCAAGSVIARNRTRLPFFSLAAVRRLPAMPSDRAPPAQGPGTNIEQPQVPRRWPRTSVGAICFGIGLEKSTRRICPSSPRSGMIEGNPSLDGLRNRHGASHGTKRRSSACDAITRRSSPIRGTSRIDSSFSWRLPDQGHRAGRSRL